jgi:hypothetical protein
VVPIMHNSRNVLLHMYSDGRGWTPSASSGIRAWFSSGMEETARYQVSFNYGMKELQGCES